MILYVNGDSHTAGAEATTPHAFAEDDPDLYHLGRLPHPDNLAVSWGQQLSQLLKFDFCCEAESASSNTRILRTTRSWLQNNCPDLVIIQWSTWEREEWLHNNVYYQVNGSGIDMVPPELQEKYRQYILGLDWETKTQEAHNKIWALHEELSDLRVKHIFFNGNNDFSKINNQKDWGTSYINPYDPMSTYNAVIRAQNINTVAPNSWHFGKEGHSFFAQFMLQYINNNKLI